MTKPSDHIPKGTKCVVCKRAPATSLTRLIAREDSIAGDAIVWGAATCWNCAEGLGRMLDSAIKTEVK